MADHNAIPSSAWAEPVGDRLTPRIRWLLLVVVCLGAAARFFHLSWDQLTLQHPDERHVLMSTWRLSLPSSVAEYFDESRSPLNPRNREAHFYAYGTLPGTLLRATANFGGVTRPEQLTLTGRALSALFDTGVIPLVFVLAWLLYRQRNTALLAAALYAGAVLPIQHAHFFVVDPFANFFIALALVGVAQAWRSGKIRFDLASGVALGLAVSCKISVATFGLVAAGAILISELAGHRSFWRALLRAGLRGIIFAVAAVVTVRVAMPDAFSGIWPWQLAPRWVANMREVVGISTGTADLVYTRQFYGRIPLLWPWWNMVAWGLGLALGLAGWAGWITAAVQLVSRRVWAHVIPVLWVAVVFFHLGLTYQSTLRYFLPIYGCLCVLAGWLLANLSLRETASYFRISSGAVRWAGRALAVFVVVFTLGWAAGFLSIYLKPLTRVEASRWIYQNIPRGSTLALEHWDDWLPLSLDPEHRPDFYQSIELPLYVADSGEKRGDLLAKLNRADYIILASQKLRDSIPRMPHRYPFTISYYQGLEDGSLGFDRVAEFTRPLNFFGWKISTRSAEEAFSVYDHPPVVIYHKSSRYRPEDLVRRFNAIPLSGVTDTREPEKPQPAGLNATLGPRDGAGGGRSILFPLKTWERMEAGGTWTAMFNRQSWSARFPLLVWVLNLFALQLLGWALLGPLLRQLPDRGAGFARLFALLITGWLVWLLSSVGLADNSRPVYWLIFAALAAVAARLFFRDRNGWSDWWRLGRRDYFQTEIVFWSGFAVFVLIRSANPDLWHAFWGGEKPMEMTYLYGVLKSEAFPPLNPWYAGGFINYYYFGFQLCAVLIKSIGVLPEVGFNLCLATFFGLCCSAAFSVARALRPQAGRLTAWCAAFFVMVFGNLFEARFVWQRLETLGRPDHELSFPLVSNLIRAGYGLSHVLQGERLAPYDADLYWVAARAIVGERVAPVTEFPFWSFLYGDLHPHLIALGYTLCVLGLLVAWIRSESGRNRLGLALLLALNLGFFWPTNTWDWPSYGAVTGVVLFVSFWKKDQPTALGFMLSLVKSVLLFGCILALGYLAFYPFHHAYVAGYGSFQRWDGERTALIDYLFIYGFFLFVLGSRLLVAWRERALDFSRGAQLWWNAAWCLLRLRSRSAGRLMRLGMASPVSILGAFFSGSILFLVVLALLLGFLPSLLLAGIFISLLLLWQSRREPLRALPVVLVLLGFGLSLLVETVVLVGDIGRMNTVFKFYYQVWVCFALASALSLPGIYRARHRWRTGLRWSWTGAMALLVAAALLFPLLGTPAKISDRFVALPRTLDGLTFAEKAEYELNGKKFPLRPDLHAIRWLQDHIEGSPIILEANTTPTIYSWGSRFATHTGLPTVVGWDWHERQQQAGVAENRVEERIAEVTAFYRSADAGDAWGFLKKYRVSLVVVGEIERLYGSPQGLKKIADLGLEKIYDAEDVQIYRVPGGPRS